VSTRLKVVLVSLAAIWVIPLIVAGVLYLGFRFDGGNAPRCRGGETVPFRVVDVQRVLRHSGIISTSDPHNQGCDLPGIEMVVVSKAMDFPAVHCDLFARTAYSRRRITQYALGPRRGFGLANVDCDFIPLGSDAQIAAQLTRVRAAVEALKSS
jgi:hypothetical protein